MGFLNNLWGGLSSLFGGGGNKSNNGGGMFQGASGSSQMPSAQGGGGLFSGNPMGAFGLGLGALGAGQLMNRGIKAPNLNTPQVGAYQNFTQNPPNLPQSMQDQINKSLQIQNEQQTRDLQSVYKSLRPGTDYTTDTNYQRDLGNLQRNQASAGANAMMGPTLQYLQPQQQALADQAQMSMYGPSLQYGQQVARANQQNQMFGNVGSMLMQNALWPNMYGGGNKNGLMSLFGG